MKFQSWNISQERLNLKFQVFSEVLICGMLSLSSYGACGLIPQMMNAIYISMRSIESERLFWGSALPLLFPPSTPTATLSLLYKSSPKPEAITSVERESFTHSP